MKNENYEALSTTDLLKKKKSVSFITGILAGMLITLLFLAIYLAITQGPVGYSLIAVALGLAPILFLNYNLVNKLNKELSSRNVI